MPLIYITGPTGSGKSTVCHALRDKGFETYDTDDEGMRKIQNVHGKHLLSLNYYVLQRLYDTANGEIIFICGTSANDLDETKLFAKIILLNISEAEQTERIMLRTNSEYGKKPHQLANAIKWRQAQLKEYQVAGAVTLDASMPLNEITTQIVDIAESL